MDPETILKALRRHAEDVRDGWGMVYLDNARPNDVSPRQFAGYLSVLEQRGLYRTVDNYAWGEVKVEQ